MRIALIASLLPADTIGGAERYVAAAARSLAERHDVVILTGSELGSVDGIEIRRLPHLPRLAADASPRARQRFKHRLWGTPVTDPSTLSR